MGTFSHGSSQGSWVSCCDDPSPDPKSDARDCSREHLPREAEGPESLSDSGPSPRLAWLLQQGTGTSWSSHDANPRFQGGCFGVWGTPPPKPFDCKIGTNHPGRPARHGVSPVTHRAPPPGPSCFSVCHQTTQSLRIILVFLSRALTQSRHSLRRLAIPLSGPPRSKAAIRRPTDEKPRFRFRRRGGENRD